MHRRMRKREEEKRWKEYSVIKERNKVKLRKEMKKIMN
jgi:hypothetical protein